MTYTEADIEALIEELYDLRKEQYDKNEEIEEIKSKMFTLKEENEELNETNEELNETNELLRKVIDDSEELRLENYLKFKQSLQSMEFNDLKNKKEIITLKKEIEDLKASLKDIEDSDTKFKEQFKEDIKEDISTVAIINYLDNQFKKVQKNNDYVKILLSNEKKHKKFYIDFTKSLLLNTTIDVFMAPRRHQNINGFCYTEFEINTRFINLDFIHYQERIKAILKDINKELARLYGDEEVRLLYIESNEFSIRCKFHI